MGSLSGNGGNLYVALDASPSPFISVCSTHIVSPALGRHNRCFPAWSKVLSLICPRGFMTALESSNRPKSCESGLCVRLLLEIQGKRGAGEGNRTPDLRFTKPLLYRLSYAG